jgi:SulP family sulfate permease
VESLAARALALLRPARQPGSRRGSNVFRPRSAGHPDDETFPGLLMVRVVGRLFFANYQRLFDKVRALVEKCEPRVLALDLSGVTDVEYTALKMLTEAEQRIRERGIALWLVGLAPPVLAVVERSPLGQALGRERMLFNLEQAVEIYRGMPAARRAEGG